MHGLLHPVTGQRYAAVIPLVIKAQLVGGIAPDLQGKMIIVIKNFCIAYQGNVRPDMKRASRRATRGRRSGQDVCPRRRRANPRPRDKGEGSCKCRHGDLRLHIFTVPLAFHTGKRARCVQCGPFHVRADTDTA